MQSKGQVFLKVLLNRYHNQGMEALLYPLPEEEQQFLLENIIPSQAPEQAIVYSQKKLEKIHYSWIVLLIKGYPKERAAMTVALLPSPMREKVKKKLEEVEDLLPRIKLPRAVQETFSHHLYNELKKRPSRPGREDVLPYDFLPETPLKPLGSWSKEDLIELINILGIYDMVPEVRQIINKTALQQLYHALTLPQMKFLRTCLQHKEKISAPRIQLRNWDGDKKKLQQILQQRGLMRLGNSLHGENSDLVWYITHTLDTGRGSILLRSYAAKASNVTPYLQQQTLFAIKFLNEQREPKQ